MSAQRNTDARALVRRRRLLLAGMVAGTLLVAGRAFSLQVVDRATWQGKAEDQHAEQSVLPAPRGTIYDRDGVPLAASQETFRVNLAPKEIEDGDRVAELLRDHAGFTERASRNAVHAKRPWVVLPGRFNAATREALDGVRGIHFDRVLQRFYPRGSIAGELLGGVSADGAPMGGLEQELDSLLLGKPGRATVRRDARGQSIPGVMQEVIAPVAGHDVYLTIDADLQEIAREALRAAVEDTHAAGGELVMADPWTGEILAAVGSDADARTWRAVTEPYEPGSTIKPFAVAALLADGKATLGDSVFAENGEYTDGSRTLTDVHGYGWLTVGQALEKSSNIALAKLSARLTPETQFAYLRGFGFGSPTAVSFPSESGGVLRRPASWSKYSQASLAIGYEISVTPLQMLMAYGALANGGVLMEPRLVREVRTRAGEVLRADGPRAVRRVIPGEVAEALRTVLVDVVEGGTGQQAALGPFAVAGKTGTSRSFLGGQYRSGAYTSSFAGFFPAVDPQLVFLVKLDSPQGAYYGGLTAAPVTRATLEAALAALSTPLDKRAMAEASPPPLVQVKQAEPVVGASAAAPESATGPFIFALDAGMPQRHQLASAGVRTATVPEVVGMSMRDATRTMHASGYRVRVEGSGAIAAHWPAAGSTLARGGVVRMAGREAQR